MIKRAPVPSVDGKKLTPTLPLLCKAGKSQATKHFLGLFKMSACGDRLLRNVAKL